MDPGPAEVFRFCPKCGAPRDSAKVGENPYHCESCGFVLYFNPVVAVATLLLDPQDRLLVLRRARDPGKDMLGLPGGFVDRGEGTGEAALREIREEIGVRLEERELSYVGSWPNTYHYKGLAIAVTDVFYSARVENFDNLDLDRSEVLHFEVHPLAGLTFEDFAFRSNARACRALREVMGME